MPLVKSASPKDPKIKDEGHDAMIVYNELVLFK